MSQLSPDQAPTMSLKLSFFPSEQLVPAVSRLVGDFCRLILVDQNLTMRYLIAAHELAENITKYASTSTVSLELEFCRTADGYQLKIHASNDAEPQLLEDVRKRLDAIKGAADPDELYDELILRSAGIEGVSGLGLARIRAEGDLQIDYTIEGEKLTITAATKAQGECP